jgi:hypothetical protein
MGTKDVSKLGGRKPFTAEYAENSGERIKPQRPQRDTEENSAKHPL